MRNTIQVLGGPKCAARYSKKMFPEMSEVPDSFYAYITFYGTNIY